MCGERGGLTSGSCRGRPRGSPCTGQGLAPPRCLPRGSSLAPAQASWWSLKKQFKSVFQNVSTVIDCVSCQKCRLHAKVTMLGFGAALKMLLLPHELIQVRPGLARSQAGPGRLGREWGAGSARWESSRCEAQADVGLVKGRMSAGHMGEVRTSNSELPAARCAAGLHLARRARGVCEYSQQVLLRHRARQGAHAGAHLPRTLSHAGAAQAHPPALAQPAVWPPFGSESEWRHLLQGTGCGHRRARVPPVLLKP